MQPSIHQSENQEAGIRGPLHALLDEKAALTPHDIAYRFLRDGECDEQVLTYGELARRSRIIARRLIASGATGKTVLLAESPGLGFIEGLFGCWHAGAIAVPAYPPRGTRHRQRLEAIRSDSGAAIAITASAMPPIVGMEAHDIGELLASGIPHEDAAVHGEGPCLLQYTSGSTASPKGVMLSHHNLRSHFRSLRIYDDLQLRSSLSWLPPYHDMGLVLKILYSLEAGIPLTFFSPDLFIQRPARWMKAISRYRADFSGGPNFALEACLRSIRDEELAGVDLSCWKAAPLGAERVRPETLERFAKRFAPFGFRQEAFLPGYGLAETTLIVTACHGGGGPRTSHHPRSGKLVSSGTPLPGVSLQIVDPESGNPVAPGVEGEITIRAAVVSKGYWNRPLECKNTFQSANGLRTGDLGYLENGELFVTGRIKDLIIIDGVNHAPEDIESAALTSSTKITAAAAFATEEDGRETITLALEAAGMKTPAAAHLCRHARRVIADVLEIPVQRVVVVRSGLLPRTTSGKIRRSACRDALAARSLKLIHDDQAGSPEIRHDHLALLLEAVAEITGTNEVAPEDDIIRFGMGSLDATRLAALLRERAGVVVSVADLFAAVSFTELAVLLAAKSPEKPALPSITPDPDRKSNVLTHAQERMWFLHQFDPGSAAYHVFGAMELCGPVSISDLEHAFQSVISRHAILRSRHGLEDGRAAVWIEENALPRLTVHPSTDVNSVRLALVNFARPPFCLAVDDPIRAALFPCGADRHILAICAHHIVMDGWSLRLLAKELAACYAGKPPASADSLSYFDYAFHHRRWVESGAIDSQIRYWKNLLAGHSGILHLPTDFPRPQKPSSEGGLDARILPEKLIERIAGIARDHRATPFMVHLSAYLLLLRQHSPDRDMVVAIPVANRNHAAAANLVGTLVNTLPFRMLVQDEDSFEILLEKVRDASFAMQANQDAPFERIVDAVKPDRSSDHAPIAQVMFDHQEIPIAETWEGGLTCRHFIAHRGAAQFDLSLLLTVFSDQQQLAIEYRSDLFRQETIASILDRHLAILARICASPSIPVADAVELTKSDCDWLSSVSTGPSRPAFPGVTAPGLITSKAEAHPARTAIVFGENALTYLQVADHSDRLASALRHQGVSPGDRVAALLERDLYLPVALLAIWKAGAAYVPLDPANPAERLRLVLTDQAPLRVLVSKTLADHLPADTEMIVLEQSMMSGTEATGLPPISPADPAYVIYTSGSTGLPKGVVVSHGALANFLLSMAETPGITEADHLLAVTTVSFDISTLELFLPLVSGGSMEIVASATACDGHLLLNRLQSSSATVMQATPATWRLLLDAGWQGSPNLKILCGGEALDLQLASALVRKGCQMWNLYGPTETTVWSTCWRVPQIPDCIRIGTPIANTGIHILSEDGRLLPPGVPGQLWISGAGLADGYWKRSDLNAERFAEVAACDGGRVLAYHTGDVARWHEDGTLECLGRSDGQLKIRGFRVEPGEIEAVLASHPQVAQARVALRGNQKLVGWITVEKESTNPCPDALKSFLAERLPVYMLPADIGIIESFPLNSSGKVDLSKLADPEAMALPDNPVTATEAALLGLWRELLERSSVRVDDNWFHIGGHSLLALRLFARIHQDFNRRLPLSAILAHPTPRALAAIIDASQPETGL